MFVRLKTVCALGRRGCGVGGAIALFATSLAAANYRAGEWPLEVSVAPDQPAIGLGEPGWLSFTVANLSGEPLQLLVGGDYQNQLGRPASFVVRAVAKDGRWIDQPDAGTGTGGLIGPQPLPAGGSYVFRLFLPHWATFTEAGTCTIICRRTLQVLRPAADGAFARQPTSDVAVEARTTLGVLPRDNARIGARIAELGERMLAADGGKPGDEAVIGLSWIDDPRAAPYFRRALKIRSYALRFIAVQVLARYGTDEALAGLQDALAMTSGDFDYVTGAKAAELAAIIRAAAVGALGRCPHPRAPDVLVAQKADPAEPVRLAVIRAVARMPAARSLPVLEEMARDGSAAVRDEARRYVVTLQGEPGAAKNPPAAGRR